MTTTATAFRPPFGIKLDRNRERRMVFYGRVSTEHEAQLSALENQIQWYDDQARGRRTVPLLTSL
jgi:predicted site-specific integrase-resolvase